MKDDLSKRFEKNVDYLVRNIPPDDIYPFAEKIIMTAMFFLRQWANCEDLDKRCAECSDSKKLIDSILIFEAGKANDVDVKIDLMMEDFESDD